MNLWIDCEYNEFQGELISMALVDEHGAHWYRSLGCENPGPWVAVHVMPIIGLAPISKPAFQESLQRFLMSYDAIHLIADWPEDIAHFCQALITAPGQRLNTPALTMEVVRIEAESTLPHNALADAQGIRQKMIADRKQLERALTE